MVLLLAADIWGMKVRRLRRAAPHVCLSLSCFVMLMIFVYSILIVQDDKIKYRYKLQSSRSISLADFSFDWPYFLYHTRNKI